MDNGFHKQILLDRYCWSDVAVNTQIAAHAVLYLFVLKLDVQIDYVICTIIKQQCILDCCAYVHIFLYLSFWILAITTGQIVKFQRHHDSLHVPNIRTTVVHGPWNKYTYVTITGWGYVIPRQLCHQTELIEAALQRNQTASSALSFVLLPKHLYSYMYRDVPGFCTKQRFICNIHTQRLIKELATTKEELSQVVTNCQSKFSRRQQDIFLILLQVTEAVTKLPLCCASYQSTPLQANICFDMSNELFDSHGCRTYMVYIDKHVQFEVVHVLGLPNMVSCLWRPSSQWWLQWCPCRKNILGFFLLSIQLQFISLNQLKRRDNLHSLGWINDQWILIYQRGLTIVINHWLINESW